MTSRYGSNEDTYSSSADIINTTQSQSLSQGQSGSSTTTINKDYMSEVGRQALNNLLAQLAAGGTPAQRQIQEDILRTIQATQVKQAEYSKENAFAESEGLMNQALRQALESTLPSILLAGEAAGTSGSAISALLTNDLTARAAEGSAALGINAAVDYGQIAAQLLDTQAGLANRDDPAVEALIAALGVDKGSRERGTVKEKSSSKSSSSSSSSTRQVQVGSTAQSSDASNTNQITVK